MTPAQREDVEGKLNASSRAAASLFERSPPRSWPDALPRSHGRQPSAWFISV